MPIEALVNENCGIMNYAEENTEVFNKCFGLHVGKYQYHLTVYINGKIFPP